MGDLIDAYLQDYQVRQFRSVSTARGRTAHLAAFFGRDARAATLTTYQIRQYQLARRAAGAATGTINRETSALHRMGTLAVHWGWLDTVPGFPDRLRENPPRQGFFEHPEYLAVRAHLPAPWQDILDLAYYSGWRKQEILGLTWEEIDEAGGVIRLSPGRSKTLVGRILPISPPIAEALARRRARRDPGSPLVFHRDGIPIRRWRTAWRTACQAAGVPTRFPPRLSPHCRAQPDPRERPRTRRHAPDRAQEPRHLRPLQHYSRAGTARRRGPTRRVSRATGAGGTSPPAAPPGRTRRPAHRITPPPRTTRHRVKAHGPRAPARGRGRQWPDTARLCAAAHVRATDTNRPAIVAHAATGQADAAEHEHTPGPAAGASRKAGCHSPGAGPHPPAGRRLTVAASGLMPGGRAARDEDGIHEGCVATFKKRQESDGSGRAGAVSCNHPEQLVDELNLSPTIRTAHPPRLPLPDHVHGLVALDRSPRRVECTKALLRCHASFDRSMILLHDVVHVLDRSVAATASQDSCLFHPPQLPSRRDGPGQC